MSPASATNLEFSRENTGQDSQINSISRTDVSCQRSAVSLHLLENLAVRLESLQGTADSGRTISKCLPSQQLQKGPVPGFHVPARYVLIKLMNWFPCVQGDQPDEDSAVVPCG